MLLFSLFKTKKYKRLLVIFALIIIAIIIGFIAKPKNPNTNLIKVSVKKGKFEISISATGDLEAKNSESIKVPDFQSVGLNSVKIEHLVPNGTLVQKGDYIASLDRSNLNSAIRDRKRSIEESESKLITTKLDTTMTLRSARNDLINKRIELEQIDLELEQSIYEPPATIKKIKNNKDKMKRSLSQAIASYKLKEEQEKTKIKLVIKSISKSKEDLDKLIKISEAFTIYAPKDGMVIYPRFARGRSMIGLELNPRFNLVAELPNLDSMISRTNINEVDISKIKIGQNVQIIVDAFPDKKYNGKIVETSIIGKQYLTSIKLFEVLISLVNEDGNLKPSMTSKNRIIIKEFKNVLHIPQECIYNQGNENYVFAGRFKKQVIVGESNDNEIIILEGLTEGEEVYLNRPSNPDSFKIKKLNKNIVKTH